MASVESLIPHIYHEKQEPGSMLCAQHALNALLQGNYFSAPDLSAIAHSLDSLESSYDDENDGRMSTNMDDTGFFSVQVLENALQVWGLSLVRWRGASMRAYQEHPHTQIGFILNLNQHWYTLRRFGRMSARPVLEDDPGLGHWFNLNSFLDAPERVGRLYLGMVLQQAEAEGYSVFAVIQTDPEGPLALPRTDADDIAATIPEFVSPSGARASTSAMPPDFEEEDYELQAALQASLMGAHEFPAFAPAPRGARAGASSFGRGGMRAPAQFPRPVVAIDDSDGELDGDAEDDAGPPPLAPLAPPGPVDPVAASMARNRMIMERMRREQEMALREGYEAEAAHVERAAGRAPPPAPAPPQWAHAGEWGAGDDAELQRALAESEALARAMGHGPAAGHDEDDDAMDEAEDEDGEYYPPPVAPPRAPVPLPQERARALPPRVYDDEDAELQAALRASLESVPPGFVVPRTPPPATRPPAPVQRAPSHALTDEEGDTESDAGSSAAAPPVELSMEEIRRRRLARFGG